MNRLYRVDDIDRNLRVARPVYYSAERGYNVEKLLDMVIDNMPRERRRLVA